ncbi:NIN-like protein [Tanacetum coccineum]
MLCTPRPFTLHNDGDFPYGNFAEADYCKSIVSSKSPSPFFTLNATFHFLLIFSTCSVLFTAITGLEPARDEIQEAIKSVCESHQITLAQVWIAYENVNRVPFSSSIDDTGTKQMSAFKLTGYSLDKDSACFSRRFKDYYDACDIIVLKIREKFQAFKPHFCEKVYRAYIDELIAWASPPDDDHFDEIFDEDEGSGFAICLSCTDTGDFCYLFEFLWLHNLNYLILLEALLLTLKRCLPRFIIVSGEILGEELHVIDVENSTDSQIIMFKIFQYGRITSIREAMEKGKKRILVNYNAPSKAKRSTKKIHLSREDIEKQYGKTMEEAANILGVSVSTLKRNHNKFCISGWQGPDLRQRKANNPNINQNDMIKFDLPISEVTFVTVKNIIGMRFKLTLGYYKLKYLDEDSDWILIDSDQDMSDCIKNSRKEFDCVCF